LPVFHFSLTFIFLSIFYTFQILFSAVEVR
jgi:hypothetical protein